MPNLVSGEESDQDNDGKSDRKGDSIQEEDGEKPPQSSIPLSVTIYCL
jgi:complement component 1 Q subcomponent-binding protein, mitochondrial